MDLVIPYFENNSSMPKLDFFVERKGLHSGSAGRRMQLPLCVEMLLVDSAMFCLLLTTLRASEALQNSQRDIFLDMLAPCSVETMP